MVLPLISSSPSSSSRSSRMRNLKKSISTLGVNISSKAEDRTGWNVGAVVFHRAECGYPNVSKYLAGGRVYVGCDIHLITDLEADGGSLTTRRTTDKVVFRECERGMSFADLIWYGELDYNIETAYRNKIAGKVGADFNWTSNELSEFKNQANRSWAAQQLLCN